MSFWEIVTSAVSDYNYLGAKTTWNTIQGTSFTNIIGLPVGGRFNNVMGNDVRIVCPWWALLFRHILGPTKGVSRSGFLLGGIGGDTEMVFGPKNSFTYFSATANCEFGINKIEINYQVPDGMDIATALKVAGAKTLYYLPVITAELGALVLTVMTLCLKHIWRFSSSTDPSNDKSVMTVAMGLFPTIETEWLYLVQYLHARGASLIPLKISNGDQLSVSSSTTPILEAQMRGLEGEIEMAEIRAKDVERSLIDWEAFSSTNPALWAVTEPAVISIPIAVEFIEAELAQYTEPQAQSIAEILNPTWGAPPLT